MKRDGDLQQTRDFRSPHYRAWKRNLIERRRQEKRDRISDIVLACCQGLAMAVLVGIFLIFLAW